MTSFALNGRFDGNARTRASVVGADETGGGRTGIEQMTVSQAMRLFEVDKVFAFEVVRGDEWGRAVELAIYTSEPLTDEERGEVEGLRPEGMQFFYRLHPDAHLGRRRLN